MSFTAKEILDMENPFEELCSDFDVLQEHMDVINKMEADQQQALVIKIVKDLTPRQLRSLTTPLQTFVAEKGFAKMLYDGATLTSKILSIFDYKMSQSGIHRLLADKSLIESDHPLQPLKIALINKHGESVQNALQRHVPALKAKCDKLFAGSAFALPAPASETKDESIEKKSPLTKRGSFFKAEISGDQSRDNVEADDNTQTATDKLSVMTIESLRRNSF